MPDLDLIKQGEQGVRDRRGRFASGQEDTLGTTVSVAQAKSQFAALVARAEAGERIVVTRNGRAAACLGPFPRRQNQIWRAPRCVPVEGFDRSGRGHSRFRAKHVIAANRLLDVA